MSQCIDFAAINAAGVVQIEAVCQRWLPSGKRNGAEWEAGDRSGSEGRSLKVHLSGSKAGMWADFAAGDKGGDPVSLVAYIEGVGQGVAAKQLAAFLGLNLDAPTASSRPTAPAKKRQQGATWVPVLPVPDNAPAAPAAHYRHGAPDTRYTYLNQSKAVLGYVTRWEARGKRTRKEFGWQVFARHSESGAREWRWMGFPVPRPLYGLELLPEKPEATVILCEGEKAAEACRVLTSDHVALTWPGGSKAADKADLSPLLGRDVILWADADEPGKQAMKAAAKLAEKAGAKSVRWLSLPVLRDVRGMGELPGGFDAADLLADGWTAERFGEFLSRSDAVIERAKDKKQADIRPADSRFSVSDAGVHYLEPGRDGDEPRVSRVCDPLQVPALARDLEGGGWAPVLVFDDMDGHRRQEIIPRRLFLGDGTEGPKMLADCGLYIEPGRAAMDRLKMYVASARPGQRARLLDTVGWHGSGYLMPDGVIGNASELLIFRGSRRALGVFTPKGKLAQWRESIARLAVNNPRLMFVLSVAFSGPLLRLAGGASCAFHLVGDSSLGKSGALTAAGSVWGDPTRTVHSWRATDNALEYVAAQHNDGLLILDELKEVDPRQAGQVAYMLSNSQGKSRAHHSGGLREAITWRVSMLSSGELGLADHLAQAGQKTHAGQEVRFIELPADAGKRHGMWSDLHGLADGGAFTEAIKAAASKHHGTAARAFVEVLTQKAEDIPATADRMKAEFMSRFVPGNAGGQVRRVASSFAMVATAGELVAEWDICPWRAGEALEAAGLLFKDWLNIRPTVGNLEDARILAHVRQTLERHWMGRFIDWHRATEPGADLSRMAAVHEALGFRRDMSRVAREYSVDYAEASGTEIADRDQSASNFHFYIMRERFKQEFCAAGGFSSRRVAKLLRQAGILKCDSDGATWKETLPNGDPRSYVIIAKRLWEAVGDA